MRWSVEVPGIVPTVSFSKPVFGLAPDGGTQFVFVYGTALARVDCDDGQFAIVAAGSAARIVTNSSGNIYRRGRGYDSAGDSLIMGLRFIEESSLDGTVYAKFGSSIERLDPEDGSTIGSFSGGIGTLDGAPITRNPDDTRPRYGGNALGYESASVRHADTTTGSSPAVRTRPALVRYSRPRARAASRSTTSFSSRPSSLPTSSVSTSSDQA